MPRRRATRWILGLLSGLFLLVATSAVVVETDWFKERLRRIVVNRAAEVLNGQLTVGRLTGSLLTGVELHRVVLAQSAGPLFAVERLALRYDPRILLRGHLSFRELSLTRPVIHIAQRDGRWNITTLVKPRTSVGKAPDIRFGKLSIVDGDVRVEPAAARARRFVHLNSNLGLSYSADHLTIAVQTLGGDDVDTGWMVGHGRVKFETQGERMTATFELDSNAGAVAGRLTGQPAASGRALDGHVSLTHANLAPMLGRPDLNGEVNTGVRLHTVLPRSASVSSVVSFQAEASSVSIGEYDVRGARATGSYSAGVLHMDGSGSAFGAHATARGEWRTAAAADSPNVWRLAGRFRRVDIRRLPASFSAPKLSSQLAGRYEFSYRPEHWDVTVHLDRSDVEGASVASGAVARASVRGRVPEYEFQGRVGQLDVRRIGRALRIAALADERYRSRINGTIHVHGRGRTLSETDLQAEAALENATVGQARLTGAAVRASLAGRRLAVDFTGPFEQVTDELWGAADRSFDLTGRADEAHFVLLDVTGPVTLDTIEAGGRMALASSVVAGYGVDQGELDAALAGGAVTVRRLDVVGADLKATAQGVVALRADRPSNLSFVLDAQDLETAGQRLHTPIAGSGHVEGAITGPTDRVTVTGTFAARQLKYGTSFDALALNGTFRADIVEHRWRDVAVQAQTQGTFVSLAGTEIDRMSATTSYHAGTLDVDTKLEQRTRTLELAGSVLFEPEQEEIRLRRLAMTTANQTWALPAGREAVIQYAGDRVTVTGLVLANGAERVSVDGSLGLGDGGMRSAGVDVKAENVQLADLNQLRPGKWTMSGELNGSAHVSGTTASPDVTSAFTIEKGAVAAAKFQRLEASMRFRDDRLTFESTLEEQPGAELKAAGTLPVALGRTASSGEAPVDLRVESTPISLGLFQPLTTHVTGIGGTGQFNLHLTGTPKAPRLDGSLDLAGARFIVEPTAQSYTNGRARMRFGGERILIDQFVLEDDDRHTLTVEGGAEVAGGRALRTMDLHIAGQDIHLLRNEFGEVGLDLDLKASGGLDQLAITGQARVERGRLEVDKLLERLNKGAYTAEAGVDGEGTDQGSPKKETGAAKVAEAVHGTLFDNTSVDVRLVMPDDMILRARDLRLSEGSVGLGSTNVTLGGTIGVRKAARGNVVVLGGVEVVRGYYEFQGRRFDIERGSELRFRGESPIDPALNVSAEREISSVTTEVALRGTARRPVIHLSSYPPLEESDILSLIVFGQPVNSLGESQRINLAERAGSLALGAAAGPMAAAVGRALNLDLFEIRAEGQGGGPEVALGSQLGSRFFIGLRQEFGKEDMTAVQFEYRLSKLLRLVTSVGQGQQQTHTTRRSDPTGADLIFVIRY